MFSRRSAAGLVTLACLLAAAPIVAYTLPGLVGADETRIVQTGSMEPAIAPGDVVFIDTSVPIDEIREGDVVTFRPHADAESTYTHRVIDVSRNMGGTVLETKGDANEDPDPMRTDASMLVGRVDHTLPVYGKAIVSAKSLPLPLILVGLSLATIAVEVRGLASSSTEFEPVAAREPEEGAR